MAWLGIALLVAIVVLMVCTGWPTYAVVLGVGSVGAVAGLAAGSFDAALLANLPARLVGLLEQDLLQALALYAWVGALLHRLALADRLYAGLRKLAARVLPGAASETAGLALGLLMAPMNGSVGASLGTLARSAARPWAAEGRPPARRAALVALASTLGVVVPPSLVLLLLGDAMMGAHTQALNLRRDLGLPELAVRIVNTQDVVQAALLPAAAVVLLWLAITAWHGRARAAAAATPVEPITAHERRALIGVPLVIGGLLLLVLLGLIRAVEAAATAGVALTLWGLATRQLTRRRLRAALDDAMAMTGALFALLLAATSFSLVLRGLGTDRLVAQGMQALQGSPGLALGAVLGGLLLCAFVLDAFELIFLVVPIVMPPLLAQGGDAAQVAVLALLVLQAGFLLPPFGYALVLARGRTQPAPSQRALLRVLTPYLLALATVIALVAAVPACTRWLRSAPELAAPDPALPAASLEDMLPPPPPLDANPADAAPTEAAPTIAK